MFTLIIFTKHLDIIAPRRFSYYENERLSYNDNCSVAPELYIKFN